MISVMLILHLFITCCCKKSVWNTYKMLHRLQVSFYGFIFYLFILTYISNILGMTFLAPDIMKQNVRGVLRHRNLKIW